MRVRQTRDRIPMSCYSIQPLETGHRPKPYHAICTSCEEGVASQNQMTDDGHVSSQDSKTRSVQSQLHLHIVLDCRILLTRFSDPILES